jgi:hypothetical protein
VIADRDQADDHRAHLAHNRSQNQAFEIDPREDGRHGKNRGLSARFSPDRQRVLTASAKTVRLWDALTGKAIGEPMQGKYPVDFAHFSPDKPTGIDQIQSYSVALGCSVSTS